MGKDIKPSGGGIRGWVKGAVLAVAKSGAASETWKIVRPYVVAAVLTAGTTIYGIVSQAPGIAIMVGAVIVFAVSAIATVQVLGFLDRRRARRLEASEPEKLEPPASFPPGPPWTDSSGRTYEMGEYSSGRPTNHQRVNETLRAAQANLDATVAELQSSPSELLRKHAPYMRHDVGLAEAVLFALKGRWGLTFESFDPRTESSKLDDVSWAFEEKAEAGWIEIWGSDAWEGGRYSLISPEEWKTLKIERQSLREDSPRVTGRDGHSPEPREYYNLRVNRAQIEDSWPAESGSVPV